MAVEISDFKYISVAMAALGNNSIFGSSSGDPNKRKIRAYVATLPSFNSPEV
jgi:hypothetical protein